MAAGCRLVERRSFAIVPRPPGDLGPDRTNPLRCGNLAVGFRIARLQPYALVDAEPGVFPRADAGKTVLEVATAEKSVHHRADDRPPEAIALLVTLSIDCLKLRIEALDQ